MRRAEKRLKVLVSEETVVLCRWGSETRKFGLSTELIM